MTAWGQISISSKGVAESLYRVITSLLSRLWTAEVVRQPINMPTWWLGIHFDRARVRRFICLKTITDYWPQHHLMATCLTNHSFVKFMWDNNYDYRDETDSEPEVSYWLNRARGLLAIFFFRSLHLVAFASTLHRQFLKDLYELFYSVNILIILKYLFSVSLHRSLSCIHDSFVDGVTLAVILVYHLSFPLFLSTYRSVVVCIGLYTELLW